MTKGAAIAALSVAVLVAACTSDSAADVDPTPTVDPQPTFDVTEGVDESLVTFYSQRLGWVPCDEFECTTLEVPLDYDEPDGETIELAVLRAPATGDDPIGSLLVNPGGPGTSGIDFARSPDVVTADVRDRYDIVGFDPRGVGRSTPLECLDDAERDALVAVDGIPVDDDALDAQLEQYETLATSCETYAGDLMAHVGTSNVARDLDILRAALGDESLHYLGKSYGTYIGVLYAEEFPERVGQVVLDGAIDPTLSGEDYALGQASGIKRAVTAYIAWCVEGTDCPLGEDEGTARSTLAGLFDESSQNPLPTTGGRSLTRPLAMLGVLRPLYAPSDQAYVLLNDALREALGGDGTTLLRLADDYLGRNEDGTYDNNRQELFSAVHCVDRPADDSVDAIEASLEEFEAASPIFGPFLAWGALVCSEWPVSSTAEPEPVVAAGAAPILVIGTTGDLATPYEWAIAVADQLESGVLLTYDGVGHLAYRSTGSDCITDAVDAYLLEGELPDEGLECT